MFTEVVDKTVKSDLKLLWNSLFPTTSVVSNRSGHSCLLYRSIATAAQYWNPLTFSFASRSLSLWNNFSKAARPISYWGRLYSVTLRVDVNTGSSVAFLLFTSTVQEVATEFSFWLKSSCRHDFQRKIPRMLLVSKCFFHCGEWSMAGISFLDKASL